MLTRRKFLAASASAAALVQAGPVRAQAKPPIRVGLILPMTGVASAYGILYKAAFEMAAADLNAKGGVNGSKVELMVEDDQANPAQSVLVFRKLVSQGAFTVFGPVTGTSWESTTPIANQMKTPAIGWTALKPGVSARPYALRLHPPNDSMLPEGLSEFLKVNPGIKRVVIAGDQQEASAAAAIELYQQEAKARGLTVVDTVSFQTRTTDFSPIAIKIRGANPDALLFSALGPPALGLLKELEAQAFDKVMLGDSTIWAGGAFIHAVGSAGRRLYTLGFSTNEPNPANVRADDYVQRFLKFSAENTNLPQPVNVCNTSLAYDTLMLGAGIMAERKIDGSSKPEAAREAVKDGLVALPRFEGINTITMRKGGDGHIQAHLLKADVEGKIWRFALPPDERLTQRKVLD